MINKIKISIILFISLPFTLLAQYNFTADVTDGCDSITVNFTFTSTAIVDSINYIIWDFFKPGGYDTTYSASEIMTTKYTIPANYPVVVYINSTDYDPVAVKNNYIHIHRTVTAEFTSLDTSGFAPNSFFFEHVVQPLDPFATYTFSWNFGDGTTGSGEDIIHTYSSAGTYNILLTVTDNFGCMDTKVQSVTIIPPKGLPDVIADKTNGCDTVRVQYNLVNVDTDTITTIVWNFGNGESSNLISPDSVTYYAGNLSEISYSLQVYINGDAFNPITKPDIVTVYKSVRAYFNCVDTLRGTDNIIKVCYHTDPFFNPSSVYQYSWQMEGFSENNDIRPLYTFANEPDTVAASLTITDLTYGCSNTFAQNIILATEIEIQNVFTPNDDGLNDIFIISTSRSVLLTIKIYNRSGLLVYQAEGTEIVWHGRTESGIELNTGIYYYILTSSENDDPTKKYHKTGFIYLLR